LLSKSYNGESLTKIPGIPGQDSGIRRLSGAWVVGESERLTRKFKETAKQATVKRGPLPGTDDSNPTVKRRTFAVTADTLKKVQWVRELLKTADPDAFTIRGLAEDVKARFGTSMNTNLLAELLASAREGEIDSVEVLLTTSKRGRPTTLSPESLARRHREQQFKKITAAVSERPVVLVFRSQGDDMVMEAFATEEEARVTVAGWLANGVHPDDIVLYSRSSLPTGASKPPGVFIP